MGNYMARQPSSGQKNLHSNHAEQHDITACKSTMVDANNYLLTVYRYIELAPHILAQEVKIKILSE